MGDDLLAIFAGVGAEKALFLQRVLGARDSSTARFLGLVLRTSGNPAVFRMLVSEAETTWEQWQGALPCVYRDDLLQNGASRVLRILAEEGADATQDEAIACRRWLERLMESLRLALRQSSGSRLPLFDLILNRWKKRQQARKPSYQRLHETYEIIRMRLRRGKYLLRYVTLEVASLRLGITRKQVQRLRHRMLNDGQIAKLLRVTEEDVSALMSGEASPTVLDAFAEVTGFIHPDFRAPREPGSENDDLIGIAASDGGQWPSLFEKIDLASLHEVLVKKSTRRERRPRRTPTNRRSQGKVLSDPESEE